MGRLQLHLLPRKLIEYSIKDEDYKDDCSKYCSSSDDCKLPNCYPCAYSCVQYLSPPPPPPPLSHDHSSKPRKFLIITLTVFAITFVALCCYVFYFKYYLGWRASRRRSAQPQINETHDDFLNEDHGPVVDHHIWYINTVGLQPSVISSITVCKYNKGDGLVEGSECSVCLNEFQEDETLRLLPKCSHAFHIPCIDTWLRSHTNCPLCRAPIVKNNTAGSSSSSSSSPPEINTDDSATNNDTQVPVLQDNEETERDLEEEALERRIAIEEAKRCENSEEVLNEIQPIRRSVSLDSLSASKLSQSLANFVIQEETRGDSDDQMERQRDSNIKIVSKRVSRSESLRRFLGSSPIGRSLQIGPVSFKRSVSCSGKFLFPRNS